MKSRNNKLFLTALMSLGVLLFALAFVYRTSSQFSVSKESAGNSFVVIEGMKIFVEIARTPHERAEGLSFRKSLPAGQGMLFVFEQPGLYSFWMKDMNFPLDIIWFDEEGAIVDLKSNAPPFPGATPAEVYSPAEPAKYVLEVNAGTANTYGWTVGSRAVLQFVRR